MWGRIGDSCGGGLGPSVGEELVLMWGRIGASLWGRIGASCGMWGRGGLGPLVCGSCEKTQQCGQNYSIIGIS